MNLKAVEGSCSSAGAGGSCNCESIAACDGSRSDVSMSANVTAAVSCVEASEAVEAVDFSRLSHAAFSSSSLFRCQYNQLCDTEQ